MTHRFPVDFIQVKPYGNQGDLKCDGYDKASEIVFQVYAPGEFKEAKLRKKIREDFEGACKHWQNHMTKWVLVHNGIDGLPPYAVQLLLELEKTSGVKIEEWAEAKLRTIVFELEEHQLTSIFGPAPSKSTFANLEFEELESVVEDLAKLEPDPLLAVSAPSPQKLSANSLSDVRADLLKIGRQRERLVQDYFEEMDTPDRGNQIAAAIRQKYSMLKSQATESNKIFDELHAWVGAGSSDIDKQAASLAVLSYFFERCDIFEDAVDSQAQK